MMEPWLAGLERNKGATKEREKGEEGWERKERKKKDRHEAKSRKGRQVLNY